MSGSKDAREEMRNDLRFICSNIEANLRYAEGKHTAFVAFNGIAIFGGFGILRNIGAESGSVFLHVMLIVAMLVLIAAVLTCIYSYFPKIIRSEEGGENITNDNLLFFEAVKLHSKDSYARLLSAKYGLPLEAVVPLDYNIISQVIVNARLASRKFAIFRLVAFFDTIAVVVGMGGVLLAAVIG